MENISFKSQIKTIPQKQFFEYVQKFGNENSVNFPWTAKQSVFRSKAFTKNIMDCTALGITDGCNVLLMHLCPTRRENKNFSEILDYIKDKLGFMNKTYLQAFVLGSTDNLESKNFFINIINFLNELKIPTSYFRGVKGENHVAYWSATDEWVISNANIKPFSESIKNLRENFSEIKISEFDKVV